MAESNPFRITHRGYGFWYRILPCANPTTEPIVVVSGAYQDMNSYRRFDEFFSGDATIVGVDLPGTHTGDDVPSDYGFADQADALATLVDTLELPRINLLGISNGFPPAYRYAQRAPERIARLALTGAAAWSDDLRARMGAVVELLTTGRLEDFARSVVALFLNPDPGVVIRNRDLVRRALFNRLSRLTPEEARPLIAVSRRAASRPAIRAGGLSGVRALCLTGEYDTFTPPATVRALAAEIDGALFTTIREADHLASAERPGEWARTLLAFFTDRPLDGAEYLTPLRVPDAREPV